MVAIVLPRIWGSSRSSPLSYRSARAIRAAVPLSARNRALSSMILMLMPRKTAFSTAGSRLLLPNCTWLLASRGSRPELLCACTMSTCRPSAAK